MAKILAPYSLCPLVEHKNFLGIADDKTNDSVIVTFSKNMVIRFQLSDQKTLGSWTTKNKLSAPVVFDFFKKEYIGVYNSEEVTVWVKFNEKPKTYKFKCLIHSIVSSREVPPYLVFMNGAIAPLNLDKESRKEPAEDFIPSSEHVENARLVSVNGNKYVSLLTKCKNMGHNTLYLKPIHDGKEKIVLRLVQKDKNIEYACHTILESDTSSTLITLWSNGDLNVLDLAPAEENILPGRLVGQITFINPTNNPMLYPVSRDQVAILGSQPSGEGAVIAIYSVKFGVVEASEKLKIYNNVEKSFARGKEVIIPSGESLLVIQFKLEKARLAGLIGSQAEAPSGKLEDLAESGVAQSRICSTLLPHHIESKNADQILKILDNCSDIPDEPLLLALRFALENDSNELSSAIVDAVLKKQLIGDQASLRLIREHISLSNALSLIKTLSDVIISKPGDVVPVDWSCLLLDAHYQQYLLSKDSLVSDTIKTAFETISEALEHMDELKKLNWEIADTLVGRRQSKKPLISSRDYIIETINLY